MNKLRFLSILVCLLPLSFCYAQYTYEIILCHKDSLGSLAFIDQASGIINPLGKVSDSEKDSKLIFSGLKSGNYSVTVFSESYFTKTWNVEILNDKIDTIFLSKINYELSEVEIRARRKELFTIKRLNDVEGTSIYAGKKSEVVVLDLVEGNLAANNSRQVFAQVAGLNIYEGSDGGLQLAIGGRGLDPSRTANFNTRQNGYDISADVLGYPENYYTPPSEAISQIQILRGASSLQYGTQFGGLINFKLKEIPSFKKLEIESNQTVGSFNFFNTFNRIGLNKKKLSLNAFMNYKQGNGFRQNSEFNSINIFTNLSYSFTPNIKLKAEFTFYDYLAKQAGGLTDSQFNENPLLSTRNRNWFDVNWRLFNVTYDHKLSKTSSFSLNLFHLDASRNSVGFRGNPISLNENPITALDEQNSDGTYILPRDLIKDNFFNYGLEAKYLLERYIHDYKTVWLFGAKLFKSNNTSFQGPGSNGIVADFESYNSIFSDYPNQSSFIFPNSNVSLFSEQIFYLSSKWSITPGIRYEFIRTQAEGTYNQIFYDIAGNPIDSQILSETKNLPRSFLLFGIGSSYTFNNKSKINVNISQNYRSVTFSDIRVTNPTYIVDPEIRDESGFTADINYTGKYKNAISYNAGVFSIYYNDRIGILLDDRANRVRKNIGSAIIGGIESLVDVNLLKVLNYSTDKYLCNGFLNTAFTYSRYIDSELNNVVGNQVEFIPIANIKAGINTGYKNVLLTLQYSYISDQFTDVQNSIVNSIGSSREGIIGNIPSYNILDLTFSYTYNKFKLSTGINNVRNTIYFTRRATGYPGPGIIPSEPRSFFISLSYKY